jgi:hypothetical protein
MASINSQYAIVIMDVRYRVCLTSLKFIRLRGLESLFMLLLLSNRKTLFFHRLLNQHFIY